MNRILTQFVLLFTIFFSVVLKRSDFGMKKYLPGLGDDVQIDIETEAN